MTWQCPYCHEDCTQHQRERDELRAEVERLRTEHTYAVADVKLLEAEVERLQREKGALARMYALAEEKLRERTETLEAVAEAAQGVINCLDFKPDDRVWDHASGGACLNLLDEALNALCQNYMTSRTSP